MNIVIEPIKRLVNLAKGYPDEVEFEPTNYCNLKCPLCFAARETMEDPLGYMDIEDYAKIIEQIKGKVHRISFSGRGEPTLNSKLFEMIKIGHDAGISTVLNSNANSFDDVLVEKAISSGLDKIYMSLDGLTQETYETFRHGGKVNRVFRTLGLLSQEKLNRSTKKPYVLVNFILTKYSQKEAKLLKNLPDRFPAIDKIQINLVSIPQWHSQDEYKKFVDEFVPHDDSRYNSYQILTPNRRCGDYKRAFITWQGNLRRCCNDTQTTESLGNVFKDGFFPVWNKQETKNIKQQAKQKTLDICDNCVQSLCYMHRVVYEKR